MKIVRAKALEGRTGGVGGMDAWDGDMVLQDALWLAMSAAMPGQKTNALAFDCIIVVPW